MSHLAEALLTVAAVCPTVPVEMIEALALRLIAEAPLVRGALEVLAGGEHALTAALRLAEGLLGAEGAPALVGGGAVDGGESEERGAVDPPGGRIRLIAFP